MEKREIWKMIINVIISALTALTTALGMTACSVSFV